MNNSILNRAVFSFNVIFLMLTISILSACGGGGGSDDSQTPVVNKGVFLDSRSEGIHYKSGNQEGDTNSKGEFEYEKGKKVTFSIGTIVLGEVDGKDAVTPIDLVPGAQDETHPWVTNRTRFLLTLDEDGYPANGITINQKIREEARNHNFSFDRDEDEFENDPGVTDAVSRFTRHHKRGEHELEDRKRAHHHLRETREHMGDNNRPSLNVSCPADPSYTSDIAIAFTSNNSTATFSCSLDSGTPEDCASPFERSGLTDGTHTFEVTATSYRGKTRTDSCSWTIDTSTADTTAPETTIDTMPYDPTSRTYADFTFSANEPATFECNLDNAGWVSCISPLNYSNLSDASHTFEVRATDASANVDATPAAYSWTVDTTGPVTTINSGPDSPTNSTTASLVFSANETATFECNLDNLGWNTCTSPQAYSNLTEGEHNFLVRATDSLGTLGNEAAYTWSIDTTPPVTTITTGPNNPTNASEATFTFSASESSTFECNLDSSGWETCTSPVTYNNLADGSHNFDVRATDFVGNTSDPTSYSWVIDTTLPVPPTLNCPSSLTNSSAVTVAFSSNDSVTFECSLDSNAYSTCISPYTETGLLEGVHEVAVRAIDDVGNISPPSTCSWTVDTTPPVTTIISSPEDPTNSTGASFTFSADESSTYECSLNGSAFASCNSPQAYTGLAEGSQNFQVRATDQAGNTGTPATDSWTIDTTAPETSLSSNAQTFEDGLLDGWVVGGRQISGSSSSWGVSEYSGSQMGYLQHTSFTEVNLAKTFSYTTGDLLEFDAEFSINGDVSPSASGSSNFYSMVEYFIALYNTNGDELGYLRYSAGTTTFPYNNGSIQFNPNGLEHYTHDISVAATDLGVDINDVDSVKLTFNGYSSWWSSDTMVIRFDNVGLGQANSGGLPTLSNSTNASFNFSAGNDDIVTFECSLDSSEFSLCTSPANYSGLTDGEHTFQVRATDAAGNIDETPATFTWTVDTSLPVVSIDSEPSNPSSDPSPTISFSANKQVIFSCSVDGAANEPCSSPLVLSTLTEGSHTFQVTATDLAGNTGESPVLNWEIDLTSPIVSVGSGPADPTNQTDASLSFSANEASTFMCDLNGSGFSSCTSPMDYTNLAGNDYTLQIQATDLAGNIGLTSYTWTVDLIAPVTTITNCPINSTHVGSFNFIADEESTFLCRVDNNASSSCTSPYNFSNLSAGIHTFYAEATDLAGNTDVDGDSCTWTIQTVDDVEPPSATSIIINNNATYAIAVNEVSVRIQGSDNVGITRYLVSEHNATVPNVPNPAHLLPAITDPRWVDIVETANLDATFQLQLTGSYSIGDTVELCVWFIDAVGNQSSAVDPENDRVCDTITYGVSWESGWGNWYADNGVWEVGGAPVVGPMSCYNGTQCAATVLDGNYPRFTDSRIISPAITLQMVTGLEEIHLRFRHWFSYTTEADYGQVQVQVWDDNTTTWLNWQNVGSNVPFSSGWTLKDVDLTEFAGQTVRLGFMHTDNSSAESTGWYIDDIQLVTKAAEFTGDFETGWADWGADRGVWQIGTPTAGPVACYEGTQCAGTILDGNYPRFTDSRLISATMTLPIATGIEQIHLRFWHWFAYTTENDFGQVQIQAWDDVSGTWQGWQNVGGEVRFTSGWSPIDLDLTGYSGQNIRISFMHTDNSSAESTGWYIDDILIDVF